MYVYVCERMAVWGGCESVTVHVSVRVSVYVCLFLHECLDTLLSIDQFSFGPSTLQ